MSGVAQEWAWEQKLPQITKILLVALAYHANKDGVAWPSRARLMEKTNLSRSGLKLHMRKLEEAGLVVREARFTEKGRQTSNWYTLKVGDTLCDPSTGHELVTPPLSPMGDPSIEIQYEIQEGDTNGGEPQMKVQDLMNIHQKKKELTQKLIFENALRKKGKLTPGACTYLWRNCRSAAADDNGFQAELIGKEAKMLHNAYKRIGEVYPMVVWNVMENWIAFTKYAEKQAGAFKSPLTPNVPYFVKFIEAAADYTPGQKGEGFVQLTAKPKKALTKPTGSDDNTGEAITSDELAAIGKELFSE